MTRNRWAYIIGAACLFFGVWLTAAAAASTLSQWPFMVGGYLIGAGVNIIYWVFDETVRKTDEI